MSDETKRDPADVEAMAEREWAKMTEEDKAEYDNDFDFFVYDLYMCLCT